MRLKNVSKLISAVCLLALACLTAAAQERAAGGEKLLPERVGDFGRGGASMESLFIVGPSQSVPTLKDEFAVVASPPARRYAGPDGAEFVVGAVKTRSSSAAYALLRHAARVENLGHVELIEGLGVYGIKEPARLRFAKGDTVAVVQDVSAEEKKPEALRAFARLFAETIDGEAGALPVLLLHLPDWEKKLKEDAALAVTLPALQAASGNRPVLEVLAPDFEDGTTEAVTAKYGDARLVIVEFATPQHSVEGDARINERIAHLRA